MGEIPKDRWIEGLSEEIAFWERWLSEDKFKDAREPRLRRNRPFQLRRLVDTPQTARVSVLDVGSGPISTVGDFLEGCDISILPLDPLAHEYNRMLDEHGLTGFPPVTKGSGEELLELFQKETFDIVFSANALDHAYNPLSCLRNMLAVCKRGGWVVFTVKQNEGKTQGYAGLHQWNFELIEERIRLWNREASYILEDHLADTDSIRTSVSTDNPKRFTILTVEMQKSLE